MWGGWAAAARRRPRGGDRAGAPRSRSTRCSGSTRRPDAVIAGGHLAATPMARIRDDGRGPACAASAGPTAADRPRSRRLARAGPGRPRPTRGRSAGAVRGLRASGRRIAVATSRRSRPDGAGRSRRSGCATLVDAVVCADDGTRRSSRRRTWSLRSVRERWASRPERTAVVGDSVADLRDGPGGRGRPLLRRPDRGRRRAATSRRSPTRVLESRGRAPAGPESGEPGRRVAGAAGWPAPWRSARSPADARPRALEHRGDGRPRDAGRARAGPCAGWRSSRGATARLGPGATLRALLAVHG